MRFVATGAIRRSGFPVNGNSAVTFSKVEGVAGVRVPRRFAERVEVERVVSNALKMRLCRLIFAPSTMASSRQRRADPPRHRADGSMQSWFNGC
jgi:hypothetical protein